VKTRGLLYTVIVFIFGIFSYLQNWGSDLLVWWYWIINEDTIQRPSFDIIPWLDRNTFCHWLHKVESKKDNYLAYNWTTAALWRYQFVPKYFWEDIEEVTGANTYTDFLNSPERQEAYMDSHIDKVLIPWYNKVSEVEWADRFTDPELFALIHFLWVNWATEYILTDEMLEKQKVWNIDASKYLEIVNKAMQAYN